MKFKESFKKPLTTLFVFIIGIFAVSGLSYITTVMGAAPGTNPENGKPNAFIPINTGSTTQGRCQAKNTSNIIYVPNFYSDVCKNDNDGLGGSALLKTNGVFVKTPNTTFQITGDPLSSYKYGALYVGCTGSTAMLSQSIIDRCGATAPSAQPETYLHGDIEMVDLIDPNQTGEKPLCLDKNTAAVKVCP